MSGDPDLFGFVSRTALAGARTLQAAGAPELLAGVQIAAALSHILRAGKPSNGAAAVVDASRLIGIGFDNNARRHVAAAADLRTDVALPPGLSPNNAAVRTARRLLARRLLPLWDTAREYLRKLAEGLE